MRVMLLGYSFEPRPNSLALGMTISYDHQETDALTRKTSFTRENELDLVQKFGLQPVQRLDAIKEEPPFLSPSIKKKTKVASANRANAAQLR